MKTTAELKLCIIGGHNFGKTSIAVSLLNIADATDGSVTVLGNSAKILSIKDEFLSHHGQLEGTTWDDIQHFKFRLYGKDNKTWSVCFHDYPGELFEKYLAEKSNSWQGRLWNGVKRFIPVFQRQNPDQDNRTFDAVVESKAIRLVKDLESSDALIVLLPADVVADEYKKELAIYKAKLGEFIDKIRGVNPQIPMCLAVNKWDMRDEAASELENVLQQPPFSNFYNMFMLHCKGNFFPMAVSAFGKHQPGDRTKKDDTGIPVNILEMLLALSERAESVRYDQFAKSWKGASFWAKTFFFPFKTLYFRSKGSTIASVRKASLLISGKAWGLFLSTTIIVGALLTILTIGAMCGLEYYSLNKFQQNLVQQTETLPLLTKDNVEYGNQYLANKNWVRLTFFANKINALRSSMRELEQKYNSAVETKLAKELADAHNADMNPWELLPAARTDRAKRRIEIIKAQKAKLTLALFQKCFDDLVANENALIGKIEQDKEFDTALYERLKKDKTEQCREIAKIIEEFGNRFKYRKDDLARLQETCDKLELEFAKELDERLREIDDSHPANDWNGKISKANACIKMIESYRSCFVEGGKGFEPYERKLAEQKTLIANQEHYGPFDDAFYRLQNLPSQGKIRAVASFRQKYSSEKYPDKQGALAELKKSQEKLVVAQQTTLTEKLKANADDVQKSAQARIESAGKRIEAYQSAMAEFTEDSTEYADAQKQIEATKAWINSHKKYVEFEKDFGELISSSPKGKLRRVAAFLSKYPRSDYHEAENKYEKLSNTQITCITDLKETLERQLSTNADEKQKSAQARIELARKRIEAYQSAMAEFTEDSTEYADAQKQIKATETWIASHTKYVDFEKAWLVVTVNSRDRQVNPIDEFLIKYTEQDYPEYADKIAEYNKLRDAIIEEQLGKLRQELKEHELEHKTGSWRTREGHAQERIDLINSYRPFLTVREKGTLDQLVQEERKLIDSLQRTGLFDDAFAEIKNSPRDQQLIKIAEFKVKFKQEDYPTRKAEYEVLAKIQSSTEEELTSAFKKETEIVIPKKSDFIAFVKYHQTIETACRKYLPCHPENSAQYLRIKRRMNESLELIKKYQSWSALSLEVDKIIQLSSKTKPEILLPMLGRLYSDFPPKDYPDVELAELFQQIRKLQTDTEEILSQRINTQLEQNKPDAGMNDNDRIAVMRQQLAIIDNALPYFIKNSVPYDTYMRQRQNISARFSQAEKARVFETEYTKLKAELDNIADPGEKTRRIELFEGMFPQKEYSDFKAKLDDLGKRKAHLAIEIAWIKLSDKITAHCKNMPSDSEIKPLTEFRSRCTQYVERAKEFQKYSFLASRVNGQIKTLDELKKKVNDLIGDGSFNHILEAEKKYKETPNDVNYQSLKNALDGFDPDAPGNSRREDSVDEVKKNLEKDRRLAKEMREKFQNFKRHPSQDSFSKFTRAVWDFNKWITGVNENNIKETVGYESEHDFLGRYVTFVRNTYQISFRASWDSFDFRDTNFSSRTDNNVELFVNGDSKVRIRDINVNLWDRKRNRFKTEKGNCSFALQLKQGEAMQVRLLNYTGIDREGTDSHLFWEILAKGAADGEYTCNFLIRGNGGKTKKATISLLFSGLPRLEE